MSIEPHLNLQETILPPSCEWSPDNRCWNVVRVADGFGYCLQGGAGREMALADAIVTSPGCNVILRASQLGELKLEFFAVLPQRLTELVTVAEWHRLEKFSGRASAHVWHYRASEPVAQKFTRLAALPQRDNLSARFAFLQLWAACVTSFISASGTVAGSANKLRERFREFVGRLPERELATSSLPELATQLNCSERHFRRLFREEFGQSLQACQTEMCLQRSLSLLADPDAKISTVALESGYRHRGYFNAMFVKRFGLSPDQWRRQNLAPSPQKDLGPVPAPPPGAR